MTPSSCNRFWLIEVLKVHYKEAEIAQAALGALSNTGKTTCIVSISLIASTLLCSTCVGTLIFQHGALGINNRVTIYVLYRYEFGLPKRKDPELRGVDRPNWFRISQAFCKDPQSVVCVTMASSPKLSPELLSQVLTGLVYNWSTMGFSAKSAHRLRALLAQVSQGLTHKVCSSAARLTRFARARPDSQGLTHKVCSSADRLTAFDSPVCSGAARLTGFDSPVC